MCDDPACPSDTPPPPGENWCVTRLNVEACRAVTGYPMDSGPDLDLVPASRSA